LEYDSVPECFEAFNQAMGSSSFFSVLWYQRVLGRRWRGLAAWSIATRNRACFGGRSPSITSLRFSLSTATYTGGLGEQ